MPDLSDFITPYVGRPFAWGECDCVLFCADWVLLCTGIDPAADYRGRYRTERRALRHVVKAGGLLPLVEKGLALVGAERVDEPETGNVAIVSAASGPSAAIRCGGHWVGKADIGLTFGRADMLAGWRLPCLR